MILGDSALGPLCGSFIPTVDVPLQVVVGGQDLAAGDGLVIDSFKIKDQLDSKNTCDFEFIDETLTFHPDVGDSIYVQWHGARIFGGTVDEIQKDMPLVGGAAFFKLRCSDFNLLADRFSRTVQYDGLTTKEIAEDLINIQTPLGVLAVDALGNPRIPNEGVSSGDMLDGITFRRIRFRRKKIAEILRSICDNSGLAWSIDYYRRLNLFDRSVYRAPFDLGDGFVNEYLDMRTKESRRQYRNKETIEAGFDQTDSRKPIFYGERPVAETDTSKGKRTYVLEYEMAVLEPAPVDTVTPCPAIKVNGVAQTVGIRSKDNETETGPAWFYEVGSKEITQNATKVEATGLPAFATLKETDQLEVDYKGRFPLAVELLSKEEVAARQIREGGTGIYEHVETDRDLDSRDLAIEKARKLIDQYGRVPNVLTYSIDRPGLAAGMLQLIKVTEYGIDAEYMIQSVQISLLDGQNIRTNVEALDGEKVSGWYQYFRKLAAVRREATEIGENETLVFTEDEDEMVAFSDSFTGAAALEEFDHDPYSYWLMGDVTVHGATVSAGMCGRSKMGSPFIDTFPLQAAAILSASRAYGT